jgi:hypothetical protein
VPHGGVGHRLADLCARLATWLHVPAKEGDRQGASLHHTARRPLLLAEWVGGGEIHKNRAPHPKYEAKVGSSSLLVAVSSTEPALSELRSAL